MNPLTPSPVRRGRRTLALIAVGLVVLLLTAAGVVARLTTSPARDGTTAEDTVFGLPVVASAAVPGTHPCGTPNPLTLRQLRDLTRQPVIAPARLAAAQPARPWLRALAKAIATSPCDLVQGAYAYVQTREWVIAKPGAAGTALLQDEHWLAADGSGRSTSVTTRLPAVENPPTDETFPAGASFVDSAPLDADPGALATRLDSITPFASGPQAVLRALADVNQWQAPGRDVRAAAVTVLADADGLSYHGFVTDRAGRPGIAVAALSANGASRDLILLDPHTGDLLAHEHTALRDPGRLGITEPTVLTYTLYLTHTRTPSVQQR